MVVALRLPGRKVKLKFGLMLDRKRAHPLSLGNTLTPRLQQHPYVNGKVNMDKTQPREMLAKLTIAGQSALLIPIASSELLYASKEFNGSRSGTSMLLPLHGSQELITWLAPLR